MYKKGESKLVINTFTTKQTLQYIQVTLLYLEYFLRECRKGLHFAAAAARTCWSDWSCIFSTQRWSQKRTYPVNDIRTKSEKTRKRRSPSFILCCASIKAICGLLPLYRLTWSRLKCLSSYSLF